MHFRPACYPETIIGRFHDPVHQHKACTMEKQSFVHEFQQKLLEMFRASPAADLERNIKALMGQTFNKLELVTRDEFEIQVELLRALRQRVEALEARLSEAPGAAANAYTGQAGASDPLKDSAKASDPLRGGASGGGSPSGVGGASFGGAGSQSSPFTNPSES
jgi:ubiquinone biosynthesis accessory factor UbiK